MESGQKAPVRAAWSRRSPRPNLARTRALRPEDLLTERRSEDGHVIGPYETAYDLSAGYGLDRVIINP